MKLFTGSLLLIVLANVCKAQYYYKDLIATERTGSQWKSFKDNKIRSVKLTSFEGDGSPTEGFQVDQEMTADLSRITTHTHSAGTPESWIFAGYSPAGRLTKTTDTSDTYRSISEYTYDQDGQLTAITNTSLETDNQVKDVEQHLWQYSQSKDRHNRSIPSGMLKIKNGADTTFVRFVTDERGNITEEHATRNNTELPGVYYYYDSSDRLTDIVRYNVKAKRLLPDYMFEYATGEMPLSMLVVGEGGSDYQKWLYQYDARGLKLKESCYNRQKQLLGRVEYTYK